MSNVSSPPATTEISGTTPLAATPVTAPRASLREAPSVGARIVFDKVSKKYSGQAESAVNEFSLVIEPGEFIVFGAPGLEAEFRRGHRFLGFGVDVDVTLERGLQRFGRGE